MEETASNGPSRGPLPTALRRVLFVAGLSLVALSEAVLNLARWLDARDPFLFLERWDGILPPFEGFRFGPHFGPALVLIAAGLALVFVSLFRLPGSAAASTVRPLPARPVSFDLARVAWKRLTLAALPVAIGSLVLLGRQLSAGPAPTAPAFLGALAAVGLVCHLADRARATRLLSGREVLGIAAYVALLLALGYGYRNEATVVPTILAGTLLAAVLVRTRVLALEWALFAVVALLGYAVYATHLTSWRYANVGDEWAYFGFASRLARSGGAAIERLFSMQGVYGQHPVLAGYAQAFTLRLYDANPYGWRLSESLFVFLAGLPVYAAVRSFARSRVALVAALVFLSSHVLLGASRAGYSLSQGVLPWPTAIAFLLLAARRGSLLGLFLAGVSACWAFFTCAVALPLIGVPGLLFIALFLVPGLPASRPRSAIPATLAFGTGLVLTALPGLLDKAWIRTLLEQTALNNQVPGAKLGDQVIPNFLSMLTAVLHFPVSTHYVWGAHLDPLSSGLMLVGLLTAVGLACSRGEAGAGASASARIQAVLLVSFPIICFVIGGLVPYPYPSIPRTNVLVPFYAVFAALGAERIAVALVALGLGRRAVAAVAVPALAMIPLANLYTFRVLMERGRAQSDLTMLLRDMEESPAEARFALVVPGRQSILNIQNVLDCSRQPRGRAFFLPEVDPAGALRSLARRSAGPVVILLPADLPTAPEWVAAYGRVVGGASPALVSDAAGDPHYFRLPLDPRRAPLPTGLSPTVRPHVVGSIGVDDARDVAVSGDGRLLVLNGKGIERRERDGRLERTIEPGLVVPLAFAVEPSGDVLVLDSAPARLVRVRTDGKVLASVPLDGFDLADAQGVAVAPTGDVVVAAPGAGKVIRFSKELAPLGEVVPATPFKQPTTVGFVGERLVVVDLLEVIVLDGTGHESARWPVSLHGTGEPPRLLAGQRDVVVMLDPVLQAVTVRDLEGRLLSEAGPPDYPPLVHGTAIAATTDGLVYVAEGEVNALRLYDWADTAPP